MLSVTIFILSFTVFIFMIASISVVNKMFDVSSVLIHADTKYDFFNNSSTHFFRNSFHKLRYLALELLKCMGFISANVFLGKSPPK